MYSANLSYHFQMPNDLSYIGDNQIYEIFGILYYLFKKNDF